MKRFLIIIPLLLSLALYSCAKAESEAPAGVPREPVISDSESEGEAVVADTVEEGLWDFSAKLFRNTTRLEGEESIVVSPISVIYAMGMTSNGAAGGTLKQAEETFGSHIRDLNAFLETYRTFLVRDENVSVTLANGIWFNTNRGFKVSDAFLDTNRQYYGAQITQSEFDRECVRAINDFVKENTQGLIDNVIDDLSDGSKRIGHHDDGVGFHIVDLVSGSGKDAHAVFQTVGIQQ